MKFTPPPLPRGLTRVFLARHAATLANTAHPPLLQGAHSDLPLSPEGHSQAISLGKFLSAVPLAAVYSSPLARGVDTAREVAGPHGLSVEVRQPLTECDVGRWEGKSWEQIERDDPQAYRAFRSDAAVHGYPDGENLSQVLARVEPALVMLAEAHRGQSIAVVSHNVVNRVYLAALLGLPLARYRQIVQSNAGVNILEFEAGSARVVSINTAVHLKSW